ncbi:hypothetical protein V1477_017687 [Vespula maculifrons]|uniref:Uncharacterized protein n=1 Tax=Vespula maculifrons TaxID=7453 RepID=A0ABD2B6Q4_VESMC
MLCFETAALHGNGNGRILNWQDIKMLRSNAMREWWRAVGRAALFNEKQRIGPYSDDYSPFTEPTCEKGTVRNTRGKGKKCMRRYGKVIEATRGFQYVGEY